MDLWEYKYNRCIKLSKAVFENYDSIVWIKDKIASDDLTGAAEAWHELDKEVQKLLYTAPRYGGPFTTKERAIVRQIWEIHEL